MPPRIIRQQLIEHGHRPGFLLQRAVDGRKLRNRVRVLFVRQHELSCAFPTFPDRVQGGRILSTQFGQQTDGKTGTNAVHRRDLRHSNIITPEELLQRGRMIAGLHEFLGTSEPCVHES